MTNEEYGNDIVTLTDDDGKSYSFEILDAIETDTGRYLAMVPYFADPQEKLDDSGDLVFQTSHVPSSCSVSNRGYFRAPPPWKAFPTFSPRTW